MMIAAVLIFSITLCLLLVTGWRLRKTAQAASQSLEVETVPVRSPDYYLPMERLLDEEDFRFAAEGCIAPELLRTMRTDRRRVFRQYLRLLETDFAALTGKLKAIMVHSEESREDLAATLLSARVIFAVSLTAVEVRLLLHACGFHRIPVSAHSLLEGLAQIELELQAFASAPASALAS